MLFTAAKTKNNPISKIVRFCTSTASLDGILLCLGADTQKSSQQRKKHTMKESQRYSDYRRDHHARIPIQTQQKSR